MKVFFVVWHLLVLDKPVEIKPFYAMTLHDCELIRLSSEKAYKMREYTALDLVLTECEPGELPRSHR